MKRTVWTLGILLIFFALAGDGLAQRASDRVDQKPVPAAKKKKERERALPAGAVQVAPDTWEAKRPDGSTVRYRRTPFGFMEEHGPIEGVGGARATASPLGTVPVSGTGIKATEKGDLVQFEKTGPSGALRWTRKKTELNEPERQAWEQAKAERAKAEQAKAERAKAERAKAEQAKAERAKAEQAKAAKPKAAAQNAPAKEAK